MLEMLIATLIAAFIAVVALGHVMLFKAIMMPDQSAGTAILDERSY